MATIWIDGRRHEADPSSNLLEVCLSARLDLPYFCWHPAMGSVGSCRQCAVKQFRDENDGTGRLVMACMTPAADGTRISVQDADARAFRRGISELLMVNHPHDCPVCDEGGECHLQDMTVMTGHNYRAHRFPKKTYENQDLGPLVKHEMNRCIQCYRCVHFYDDVAGGTDLQVFGAHDHVYFGRHEDGTLESEFAGNLVEVCPTGVFTDRPFRARYTRKWDLATSPSVCVHCSLGCNTIPGARLGELRRTRNRYHGAVNGHFLCDRGRYGYGFVNDPARPRQPVLRRDGRVEPVSREVALEQLASWIAVPARTVAIGSPRASVESNWAARTLVGAGRFFQGVSDRDAALGETMLALLRAPGVRSPSLEDVRECDAVLVLGEDVTATAPLLDLAVRAAARSAPVREAVAAGIPSWHAVALRDHIQGRRGPVFVVTPVPTRLDRVATVAHREGADGCARLGFAVARGLDPSASAPAEAGDGPAALPDRIARALAAARRPVVISGSSLRSEPLLHAAAAVARALAVGRSTPVDLCLVPAESNSVGCALLGGHGLDSALRVVESGDVDTVVVVENDLDRRLPRGVLQRIRHNVRHLVVLDSLDTPTTRAADLVLPAASYAEADGTIVSAEGRGQHYVAVLECPQPVQSTWRWVRDVLAAGARRAEVDWHEVADVTEAAAAGKVDLAALGGVVPRAGLRQAGQRLPRETPRYSGRTAVDAHESMHEPKPREDEDSPLAFSMEGYGGPVPSGLTHDIRAPGWNSVQALHRFQEEVHGPLRGEDSGVRLLDAGGDGRVPTAQSAPPPAPRTEGTWDLHPLAHTFGSEELSARSAPVAALAPRPYVALAPSDAAKLGVSEGDLADVEADGLTLSMPVRVVAGIPAGLAGIPVGLPDAPPLDLPTRARVSRR